MRVTYDVGLGRDFLAHELLAEEQVEAKPTATTAPTWRLMRARNKWQTPEDCAHHPFPGTFPVVVTDANDWGGWRVPGAEYDRDPRKIERQARLIAARPAASGHGPRDRRPGRRGPRRGAAADAPRGRSSRQPSSAT